MTAADVAAFDIADPERDDPAVVEGEDPVDRPCEAELQIGPAHRFAEGDLGDELRQDRREQAFRRLADDLLPGAEILPLFRGRRLQSGDVDSLSSGKAEGGRGGVSLLVEGDPAGRSQLLDHLILLPFGDLGDRQEEPAGRPHRPDLPVADAALRKLLADDLFHILERLRQKGGRDLFGSDFQEQFLAHQCSPIVIFSVRESSSFPTRVIVC